MAKRWLIGAVLVVAVLSLPFAFGMERSGWLGGGKKVAVLELTGTISDVTGGDVRSSGTLRGLLADLAEVRENPEFGAVVLRINSGGGSAAASQEIHRAIGKVREAGKPVVVSMGDIAASGGYYAAVAADEIFANPSTITGSIGVFAQYLNVAELADRYGVKLETVKTGPFKDVGNPTEPFTEAEREMIQRVVDDSLEQFVTAVAEGRNLDRSFVESIADGRIFTGNQALELGLIDRFGGVEEAVDRAAELAGIEGEPQVVHFTEPVPWYARYLGAVIGESVDRPDELELLRRLLGEESGVTLKY